MVIQDNFIIRAAGEATRWGNYLGVPKHFVKINGEPVIERAVRLLKERGAENIFVVSKDYNIAGVENIHLAPEVEPYSENLDAYLDTQHLWATDGRTVYLLGDTYYTDEAMDKIVYSKRKDWTMFCRPTGSRLTGKKWGDNWGIAWHSDYNQQALEDMHALVEYKRKGVLTRLGAWEWARLLEGEEHLSCHHNDLKAYEIIDDFTEDFDYPEDYDNFIERFNKEEFVS